MVYGGRKWQKKRVSVIVLYSTSGLLTSLTLYWDDGRSFNMSVLEFRGVRPSERLGEYCCDYLVMFGCHKRHLYRDNYGWFVEVPAHDTDNTADWPPAGCWDPEA